MKRPARINSQVEWLICSGVSLGCIICIVCCCRGSDIASRALTSLVPGIPYTTTPASPRHGHCSHSPAICVCTAGRLSDLDRRGFSMPHCDLDRCCVCSPYRYSDLRGYCCPRTSQKTVKVSTSE